MGPCAQSVMASNCNGPPLYMLWDESLRHLSMPL